jgi:hypothetical protein
MAEACEKNHKKDHKTLQIVCGFELNIESGKRKVLSI